MNDIDFNPDFDFDLDVDNNYTVDNDVEKEVQKNHKIAYAMSQGMTMRPGNMLDMIQFSEKRPQLNRYNGHKEYERKNENSGSREQC